METARDNLLWITDKCSDWEIYGHVLRRKNGPCKEHSLLRGEVGKKTFPKLPAKLYIPEALL